MKDRIDHIVKWIKDYANKYNKTTLVIGVSGGIDSAVASTLCAMTGIKVIPIVMSIKNKDTLALEHAWWLDENFNNVSRRVINLEKIFHEFENASNYLGADSKLAFANSRSRLRMMMLYQVAQSNNGLVVGTGNKVEDFGVGFYTKYGDGGVDLSPIADLMKSEVYAIAKFLGIDQEIQNAAPTDGLWGDDRTDEDQLGATYKELEWAMRMQESGKHELEFSDRQKEVLSIFIKLNKANQHKMLPIPVCKIPENLK